MTDKKKPPSFEKIDNQQSNLLLARVAAFMPEIKAANETLQNNDKCRIDDTLIQEGSDDDDDEKDDTEDVDESQQTVQLEVALSELESNKEIFDLLLPKPCSNDEEIGEKEERKAEIESTQAEGHTFSKLLKGDESKCAPPELLIQEI